MKTIVLGGGLAGLMVASELRDETIVLEKQKAVGGLCRSFEHDGIQCDIGPHILFSKNKEALDRLLRCTGTDQIKRSNQILHHGKRVKYPFENDLAALPEDEREYCLQEFLNNPYAGYRADTMLQFFLKTFGEGITRLYLQPYNEKIWKYDPSFMDTQMVDRIPKPPAEDIIKSARGEKTEGYVHQLFFNYPKNGGIQSVVEGCLNGTEGRVQVQTGVEVIGVHGKQGAWEIETSAGLVRGERLINAMPVHEFGKCLTLPDAVRTALDALMYNSIHVIALSVRKENMGDNFAYFIADKDVIFHRISKMDFLGPAYRRVDGGSTILCEITFRPGSWLAGFSQDAIVERVVSDLGKIGIAEKQDVISTSLWTEKYAYVVYDLDHAANKKLVSDHLSGLGIGSCGRFAEFEYYNMDRVTENAMALARKYNTGA